MTTRMNGTLVLTAGTTSSSQGVVKCRLSSVKAHKIEFFHYIPWIRYLRAIAKVEHQKQFIDILSLASHTHIHLPANTLLPQTFSFWNTVSIFFLWIHKKMSPWVHFGWYFILTNAKNVDVNVNVVWITFWSRRVYLSQEKWFSFKRFSPPLALL